MAENNPSKEPLLPSSDSSNPAPIAAPPPIPEELIKDNASETIGNPFISFLLEVKITESVPMKVKCKHCKCDVTTSIKPVRGCCQCSAYFTVVVPILWPIFFIAVCSDKFMDKEHICPACNRALGTVSHC